MAQRALNRPRNVLGAYQNREFGLNCNQNIAPELLAVAEDQLVLKAHDELSCEMPGLPRSTFLMVFSPDGSKVASTHGNHNVYVTDLRTGKNINILVGHPRTPWSIAFHPTLNHILATGCLGGQVRVWDLSGGSEVWITSSPAVIASLAFHPLDRLLVIATVNELYFWDWSQPRPFVQACTKNSKEQVRYVAFDRLGHKLITGVANMPTSRWDRQPTSSTNRCIHRTTLSPGIPSSFWYHRRRREPNTTERNNSVESSNSESNSSQSQAPTAPKASASTPNTESQTATTRTPPTNTSRLLLQTFKMNYSTVESNNRTAAQNSSSSYQNSEPGPSGLSRRGSKHPRLDTPRSNSRSSDSSLSSDESPEEFSLTPYMVLVHKLQMARALQNSASKSNSQPSTSSGGAALKTTTLTETPSNDTADRPSVSTRQFSVSESSAFIPTIQMYNNSNHNTGEQEPQVPLVKNENNKSRNNESPSSATRENQESDTDQSPPRRNPRSNSSDSLTTHIFDQFCQLLGRRGSNDDENNSVDSNVPRSESAPTSSAGASRNRMNSHLEMAVSSQAELRQLQIIRQINEAARSLLTRCPVANETESAPGAEAAETTETERSARTHPEDSAAESVPAGNVRATRHLHFYFRRPQYRRIASPTTMTSAANHRQRDGYIASVSVRRHCPQRRIVFGNNSQSHSYPPTPPRSFGYIPNNQEMIPLITPDIVMLMSSQVLDLIRIQRDQPQHRFSQPSFQTERNIAGRLYACHLALRRQGIHIDFEPSQLFDFAEYTGVANILFRGRYVLSGILNSLILFFETNPTLTSSFRNRFRVLIRHCSQLTNLLLLNIIGRGHWQNLLQNTDARLERHRRHFLGQLSRQLHALNDEPSANDDNIEDLSRMSVTDNESVAAQNSGSNHSSTRNSSNESSPNDETSGEQLNSTLSRVRRFTALFQRSIVEQLNAQRNENDSTNNQIQEVENVIFRTRALTRRFEDMNNAAPMVPQVQVNDVPVSEPTAPNRQVRFVAQHRVNMPTFRPRYLHPLYAGINPFDAGMDESQREQVFGIDSDYPTSVYPNHRIQVWNMADGTIPNIENCDENLVVSECRIHNDASVDISRDGNLLVTLLPSGSYLNFTNRLGVFSIQWDNLGQCLYTASFEQNAVSVSLSATSRYLAVGLASRRISLVPGNCIMAQLYKLESNGRAVLARDIEKPRDLGYTSVNCIRWSPVPGQGLVYATNTGHLKVLT